MIKAKLIMLAVRIGIWILALGVGIWYLSSAIGGASLTYTSMDSFLTSIGAGTDIANTQACFMCGYIAQLFAAIGRATEMFWTAIVDHLWILMALGFAIWIVIYTGQYIFDAMKKTADIDGGEKSLALKAWFDKIWRQGARVLIAGAFMGMIGMGGTTALKTVANVTITPVMYVGTQLSMAATGISDASTCGAGALVNMDTPDDIMNPIMQPFMCVIGNMNAVMLAGAAGGFAMMNYAWMGMGAGVLTWVAGLALVIMFLVIGFDLFFRILSVVFKLVFVIIFMPIFVAAAAFEPVWKAAEKLFSRAINMVVTAAVQIVGITLKILILYGTISYAADMYFPGPADGYSAILPPLLEQTVQNPDARTQSVMNVFSECEHASYVNGVVDADTFRECFNTKKTAVERNYPGAFDFLDDGWEFLMMMIGLFLLYYYAVAPGIDKILGGDTKSDFDFGGQIKQLGQNIFSLPMQIVEKLIKKKG